jgi:hypothetical protein
MKQMELPVGTALVDYRLKRVLGYWDGKELAASPSEALQETLTAKNGASRRIFLIIFNVAVLVCLLMAVLYHRRRASAAL